MSGFVVIDRDAMNHHIVGDPARFYAWCWLISNACWKPTKFNIQGKTIVLERGQLCASRSQLAEAWGWSPSAVERFLARLETEQMIGRATGQGRSVLTICNYAKYQNVKERTGQPTGQDAGQPADSDRTAKEPVNQETIIPNGMKHECEKDWPSIPDWIPVDAWNGYIKMRKRKRANPTARAVVLLIAELSKWRALGHDPGEILDHSTMNSWVGIFEPKESGKSNGQSKFTGGSTADAAQRVRERMGLAG